MGRWNGLQINQLMVEAGFGDPKAMNQLDRMHRAHEVYEDSLVIDDASQQMRPIEKIWAPMSSRFNCTDGYEVDRGWTFLRMREMMRNMDDVWNATLYVSDNLTRLD